MSCLVISIKNCFHTQVFHSDKDFVNSTPKIKLNEFLETLGPFEPNSTVFEKTRTLKQSKNIGK